MNSTEILYFKLFKLAIEETISKKLNAKIPIFFYYSLTWDLNLWMTLTLYWKMLSKSSLVEVSKDPIEHFQLFLSKNKPCDKYKKHWKSAKISAIYLPALFYSALIPLNIPLTQRQENRLYRNSLFYYCSKKFFFHPLSIFFNSPKIFTFTFLFYKYIRFMIILMRRKFDSIYYFILTMFKNVINISIY